MQREEKNLQEARTKPGKDADCTYFTCPAVGLIKQLQKEIASLRGLLETRGKSETELLDNSDLMREYRISKSTAQNWRNTGLAFTKRGSKLYYQRQDVETFLAKTRRRGF